VNVRRCLVLATAVALLAAGAAGGGGGVARWPVWLCKPGVRVNWCNTDLSVTEIRADGTRRVVHVPDTRNPPIDCFYVYPTVSADRRGNADLHAGREEQYTVAGQAARFAQACRVFAPLYRQTTVYSGSGAFRGDPDLAYRDVLLAWRDYLAHWNGGRGVVLIGHSQGSYVLERLVREESAALRPVLVSALLLGGGVDVTDADRVDGGFPACRSRTQTGCVVAYSTWSRTPPDEGLSDPSRHDLCVNPAAPGGGGAAITPIFPWFQPEGLMQPPKTTPSTFWLALPDLYTARCVRQGPRSWLLVTRIRHAGDRRPTVQGIVGPGNLHAADVNVVLGELVALVRAQGRAFASRH
jgi:hypothetical protein